MSQSIKTSLGNKQDKKDTQSKKSSRKAAVIPKTKVEPFSFDEREKLAKQKKEDRIDKLLKESAKARELRKTSVVSIVSDKPYQNVRSRVGQMIKKGDFSSKSGPIQLEEPYEFKAQPARVLRQKPFQPKKSDKPLVQSVSGPRNLEVRARERELFQQKLKDKEKRKEMQKLKEQAEKHTKEMAEVRRMRKQAVPKPLDPTNVYAPPNFK